MFAGCLQIMWAHLHLIRVEGVGYLQIIRAENTDVCRSCDLCLQAATATLQKRTGSHARSAQRAGQKQVGYFPTGNRKPIGKRIDPTVHRTALPHDRSESPQLAQEEWDEDAQSPNVIVRNIEKRPRERANLVKVYALSPLKIL